MLNNPFCLEWKVYIWIIVGYKLEKINWGQIVPNFWSGVGVPAHSANNVFSLKSNLSENR